MPFADGVMEELPEFLKQTCLVMDVNGVVRHGPCDGSGLTNTPPTVSAVPVNSAIPTAIPVAAIPGVTPAAAVVSPASNLMPLLLVGVVLWFITK